ncbi:MmcQ/YjbR family DNA-binding protein [Pedobacter frigiditerrae]|uniref:MmcQ/YjbR family DNA-binding protein n=1 Tax=Pedobacter frigiditerrae TaxID=2530452 RepID=A0A4V2MHV9_9SPHI|nr:MmcQ/YjbR family DNA-binding protein [Pedobacter frigiditerrae]
MRRANVIHFLEYLPRHLSLSVLPYCLVPDEFCLSFEQAAEGMPFSGFFKNSKAILVFYARNNMFCLFDIDSFDRITIRCKSEKIDQLKEKYAAIEKPFNFSHKSWVSIII